MRCVVRLVGYFPRLLDMFVQCPEKERKHGGIGTFAVIERDVEVGDVAKERVRKAYVRKEDDENTSESGN